MTPSSLLDFVALLRGFRSPERRRRIDAVVGRLELGAVLHQPIETLSKGFKRRVGLATALLHDPEVLILDEPTDGLDPNQKHQVRALLADMARDKAIIISTHILEEVDAVCSRAIIITRGRIVADARPAELEARSAHHNAVVLRLPTEQAESAYAAITAVPSVARVEGGALDGEHAQLLAFPADGAEILSPVREALARAGLSAGELYVERGRLDEVFRRLTHAA
jgi:ABC-2 type transport system ATP-binding protein